MASIYLRLTLGIYLRLVSIDLRLALRKLTLRAKHGASCLDASDALKFVSAKGAKTLPFHLGVDAVNLGARRDAVIVDHALDNVRTGNDPPSLARALFSTRSRLGLGLRAQRIVQERNLNRRRSRQTLLGHESFKGIYLIDPVGVVCNRLKVCGTLRSHVTHAVDLRLDRLVRGH